jgi:predicted Zn-dependent protease
MRARLALSLALTLALCGMARAQDVAMPLSPDMNSDEAGLGMQVAKLEQDIKTSSALVQDEKLNAYVQGIMCRVAAAACPSLRLYIVEAPGFSIASMPNGAIILWSGALLRIRNEAELAHVLGHEIAHYLHRDSLKQFNRMIGTSSAVAVLGVAASGVGIDFVGTGASMATLSARYPHSQSAEREADRTGFDLATGAGYDPRAAASIWRHVAAETGGGRDVFSRVHSSPPDRLALLAAMAGAVPRRDFWKTGLETWNAATSLWQERWIADELRRGTADTSLALFTRLSADDPARGLYRYALGEAYRKRGLPGDAALAQKAFRAALAAPDAPPLAWRGLGLMAMQGGDKVGARTAFARYRAGAPDADDKAMIDFYLAQL